MFGKKDNKEVSKGTPKKVENKVFKNISSFKRAVTQMDIKSGEKVLVTFDGGDRYEVKAL